MRRDNIGEEIEKVKSWSWTEKANEAAYKDYEQMKVDCERRTVGCKTYSQGYGWLSEQTASKTVSQGKDG